MFMCIKCCVFETYHPRECKFRVYYDALDVGNMVHKGVGRSKTCMGII